jgi:signal transduction histidine kinase/DNA-binding response OmpR family regulator
VLVVAVPLLALLVVVGMSLDLQFQERQARAEGHDATALMNAAQNSLIAGLNAETSMRGYAATNDAVFLGPYTEARRELPATLAALDQSASPEHQQAAAGQVSRGLTEQFKRLDTIRRTVAAGDGTVGLPGQLLAGKVLMDRLRDNVAAIAASSSITVQDERSHLTRIETRAEVVDIVGLILGLLGGLAGIALFAAGVARRVSAAADNARRLGQGQPLVVGPVAGDELGDLAVALSQAETLLAKRASEAAVANDALDASSAKSRFLSRTSHELRTPLNAMLGFAQLLEFSSLGEEDRDSVAHILTAGRHLVALIDDVLDISRIEAGEMTLSIEPVRLRAALIETVALMRPMAAARFITIRQTGLDPNLAANADRQRLSQILLNLVSNAIKYNRDSGSVTLGFAADDKQVEMTVTDTGPGLTAAQMQRLYVPFERLGAEQTSTEGVGIGLGLAKALTETMRGTLEVTSTPGQGSTFTVRLPRAAEVRLREPRPVETITPSVRVDGLAESRVVYIEDNLASVQVLERLLDGRRNTTLYVAQSGQLGIDLARQHNPTLILLDMHLPDLGGDVVLQRLRADPSTAAVPVVILSADANNSTIRRLLESGAAGYLTKPIDLVALLSLLDSTAQPTAHAEALKNGGSTGTVLYIEDDTLNTDLAQRLIERRAGIKLLVAHNGQAGLRLAQTDKLDLVLLDWNLPGLGGAEILAKLKQSSDTPVVVVSGDSRKNIDQQLTVGGADGFLAKPYTAQDFLAVIDRWCASPQGTTAALSSTTQH